MPASHTQAGGERGWRYVNMLGQPMRSARAVELAFLGDPLKGLVGAFDAVLMLVAIGRKKFHDLISPVCSHMTERLRREINRLTEPKLMCGVQR
jgi:hypothetical protein